MPFTTTAFMAKCRSQASVPTTCAPARTSVEGQQQRPAAARSTPAMPRTPCGARRAARRAPRVPPHRPVHAGVTVGPSGRPRARARRPAANAPLAQYTRPPVPRQRGVAVLHSIERLPGPRQLRWPFPPRRPAAGAATSPPASRSSAPRRSSSTVPARPAWTSATVLASVGRPPRTLTDIGAASSGRHRRSWPRGCRPHTTGKQACGDIRCRPPRAGAACCTSLAPRRCLRHRPRARPPLPQLPTPSWHLSEVRFGPLFQLLWREGLHRSVVARDAIGSRRGLDFRKSIPMDLCCRRRRLSRSKTCALRV